jgi:glycolate oxidase FAD binding subunit
MADVFRPVDDAQLLEAVAWAAAAELPLEVSGGGSKRALGRPVQAAHRLDVSGLAGITLYEAEELVMAAGPGTLLAEVEAALAANNQHLAFEPPDLGPLFGGAAGAGTIGGVFACNLSGPRRIKAGAARDHFLGVSAVTGRAEAIKAGGRVVKNVTGYDLCKLFAGSYGTLCVMSRLTFKVLPAPEKTRTVLVFGLDDASAARAMTEALASPHEVTGAAHMPGPVAARSGVGYVANAGAAVTAVRVEGPALSAEHRCAALREALGKHGAVEELHGANSAVLWRELRDAAPFGGDDRVVWRISVAPRAGAGVVAQITADHDAEAYYDWGGGLIWLASPPGGDGGAARVRAAVGEAGGHATLIRADAGLRGNVGVFEPEPGPLAALTGRVKLGFDPHGILNPGRMYAGV